MAKKRAPRGTGTVYERPDRGDWTGQITIDGHRHTVYGKDKTAARAAISALLKSDGQTDQKSTALTVAVVIDEWFQRDLAGRDRAPQTVELHRWSADRIKASIGKRKAATLTVRNVDDMLDQLAADGLSRSSLLKVRGTLSQALQFAVRRGELPRNVAKDATIPPSATRTAERTSLSPTEARTLLAKEVCSTKAFRRIMWMLPREQAAPRMTHSVSGAFILIVRPGYPSQEASIL